MALWLRSSSVLNAKKGDCGFYMVNMCLVFVLIDLDCVIKKDWLAFSEDNHDSFTTGSSRERENFSRLLLLMCHLLYIISLSLSFHLSLSRYLTPSSHLISVFASQLSCILLGLLTSQAISQTRNITNCHLCDTLQNMKA